jgi:RHS repeat-associated protein
MKTIFKLNAYTVLGLLFLVSDLTFSQSSTENFIHTINPLVPVQNSNNVSSLSTALRIDGISYMDGMGRTVQQVYPACSPSNKDIIDFIDYDNTGRATRQYLPFTDIITNGNVGPLPFGLYRPAAIAAQQGFYTTAKTKFKTNNSAFGDVKYDNSPLDIVKESSSPAPAWDMVTGQTDKQDYHFNAVNSVLFWKPASNGALCGNGTTPAYYAAEELSEIVSLNEDNIETKSYYDKAGKIIASKIKVSAAPLNYHYTYYVYNDFGELVCVIPPTAIENILLSGVYGTSGTLSYLFLYEYDSKGRLVKSKKPNQGWNYFFYDRLDQLVLTQNEKMLVNNQFMFYKYDAVGRPVLSGTYTNNITATALQTQLNTSSSPLFESRSNSGSWQGYTNVAFPSAAMEILSVNYYDDYDFNNDGTPDKNPDLNPIEGYRAFCTEGECNEKIQNLPILVNNQTMGLLTGSKVKILDPNNPNPWLTSASFYDEKGQTVQSIADNYSGGFDISSVSYDFNGKVTYAKTQHNAYSNQPITSTYRFLYDKMGRLHKLLQKINDDPVVLINQNKYNEIGQLVVKNIHSTNCINFLQSIDYTYNELGWLTHMNNADLNNGGALNNNDDTDDLFGYELKYETPVTGNGTIPAKFDGTISEVHWKSYSDAEKKAYGCIYDPIDRLHHARYNDYNTSGANWIQNGNYDEYDINYDPNGNITTLKRNGLRQDNTLSPIDLLTYQYNGNQLIHVNEAGGLQGYNDFKPMTGNYVYDVNGNLTYDPGKNMSISYNHLDLPDFVITSIGSMKFVYDANGTLLERSIAGCLPPCRPNLAVYTYLNGYTYYNGVLQYFDQPEGRVVPNPIVGGTTQFLNEYSLSDHLGNPRVNFCDANNNGYLETTAGEVLQENHYYPYGLDMYGLNKMQVGPVNKEKFNGSELYDELGVDLYNFGPRTYNAALGRWNNIDPMADMQPGWSPYRFGFDNPLNFNDPSGLYEANEMGNIADVYDFSGGSGDDGDPPTKEGLALLNKNCPGCYVIKDGSYLYNNNSPSKQNEEKQKSPKDNGKGNDGGGKGGSGSGGSESSTSAATTAFYSYGGNGSGSFADQTMKVLDVVRMFSPLTQLNDAANIMLYGRDSRGIPKDGIDASISLAGTIPFLGTEIKLANQATKPLTKILKQETKYTVYHGIDNSGAIRYVGITSRSVAQRAAEHSAAVGTGKEFLRYVAISDATSVSKNVARVMEQQLINKFGMQKNGGQLLNKINSISPSKWSKFGL